MPQLQLSSGKHGGFVGICAAEEQEGGAMGIALRTAAPWAAGRLAFAESITLW